MFNINYNCFSQLINIAKKSVSVWVDTHSQVLYAVPYQHFTNAIENFFSVFKLRLQKKIGITFQELIKDTIKDIPSEIMLRIFQGSYEIDEKYKRKSKRKSKQYKE